MTFKTAALNTPTFARTENGMKTYTSSLNALVDLFFQIGASRGKDITHLFERAYAQDRQLALRIAFWARDVRGGAGERETFRSIVKYLEKFHPTEMEQVISLTPEYGRWDDILVVNSEAASLIAVREIKNALLNKNGLCAKWLPRKGPTAVALRNALGMTPKQYRKTIVGLTKVVEQNMCSGNWESINYNQVPSLAAARYQNAFGRHDPLGYSRYQEALQNGEAKVNALTVYPYDVIKSLRTGGSIVVANAQWQSLPNYVGDHKILPMVDVSGSMSCPAGKNSNVTCLDVALSLGLYLSDKNTGAFKDMFLTFSGSSKIEVLKGDLASKLNQLSRAEWQMNTNLHSAFNEVLRVATYARVSPRDMPEYILILSDMQFDSCVQHDDSAIEMIRRKYEAAGFMLPNIIFWNLNGRSETVPVSYNENGTALVSGFSPAIMTSILAAEQIDPVSIMLTTINSDRYAQII